MKIQKEIRSSAGAPTVQGRQVEGYALVFDKFSNDLGGFVELIKPESLNNVLQHCDVLCPLNHDESRGVLARCKFGKGSMKLTVDERGLKYSFEAPKTALGDELIESLKRGDISGSSFAFSSELDEWYERFDGTTVRKILKFAKIYDVSPVYNPAYEDTTVACRSLSEAKNLIKSIKSRYL